MRYRMNQFNLLLVTLVSLGWMTENAFSQNPAQRIFLNYTKAALDSAYTQGYWAPNAKAVGQQIKSLNTHTQSSIGAPQRVQYGNTETEQLDMYVPKRKNAPIHIFIHGGAWQVGNGAGEQAYMGRKFFEAGVLYVAPDYELVTSSNRSLYPMVEQLRKAVVWTYRNAVRLGGNPDKIYLSGHSAGAHLAGVLIATDWTEYGLPADVIKGALLCSGMYDLYPVSLSSRNKYVEFTDKMVKDFSPIKHLDLIRTPIILAYGTQESPEFKRQSQEFAAALKNQSKRVELYVLEGYNHFELMVAMGNPYDILSELMIKQIKFD
ncbi:MAG TPA: alpha/beta hydrolase [Cyclobacteriaceae bacterium]|nr:alpha/beta hydrolase [Cyclobacteriaceae bacterium]